MTSPSTASAPRALVVLPFASVEKAEEFALLVTVQLEQPAPFVLHGTAYEYRTDEGEHGQVIEVFPDSNFESFQGATGEKHTVLQRVVGKSGEFE